MLVDLAPRLYQETILASCAQQNTLVVLPTGMGKSIIFVMLAAHRLKQFPSSKVLILVPTKPLAEQHVKSLKKFLQIEEIHLFTGDVKAEERAKLFEKAKIIVSTPQGVENDVISKKIDLSKVSLLVFDEAHRAVKDYSYVWLAKYYMQHAKYPRILGLTASPGSTKEKIQEVCTNLFVEGIEVRSAQDPEVAPYIQEVNTKYLEVELSDKLRKVLSYFKLVEKSRADRLRELGVTAPVSSRGDLLKLQAKLRGELSIGGDKKFEVMKCISVCAEIMKLQHAVELLESQGVSALSLYMEKMVTDAQKGASKAVKNLMADSNMRSAHILIQNAIEEGVEHPKMELLRTLITERLTGESKFIIFNQYRDNAKKIVEELNLMDGISAELFVGQAKKSGTGLSQKKQKQMIEDFSEGKFNVIVMTSVGEEGLDIPQVDYVIFFEPVPSAIRHIQRRGRTGRLERGEVYILMTKGTRDEIYRWSAHHKEKRMYSALKSMKREIVFAQVNQSTLDQFEEKKLKIFVDHREKKSRVIKHFIDEGYEVEIGQLEVADYILSDDVGVEFKTVEDFINSLVDGRLLEQIKDLKYNFRRPLIILEGEEDLFGVRNIHPNSIRGMLATITVTFGIPIIRTKNSNESAQMMMTIVKREQGEKSSKSFSPNPTRRGISVEEQQVHFVAALPDIGEKLAKELLERFKSPKGVVNASLDELKEVEKIGKVKAANLKNMFEHESGK